MKKKRQQQKKGPCYQNEPKQLQFSGFVEAGCGNIFSGRILLIFVLSYYALTSVLTILTQLWDGMSYQNEPKQLQFSGFVEAGCGNIFYYNVGKSLMTSSE